MKLSNYFFALPILLATGCSAPSPTAAPTEEKAVQKEEKNVQNTDSLTFTGHIYLSATVADSVQGTFIFDTGASDLWLDSLFFANHFSQSLKTGKGVTSGAGNAKTIVPMIMEPFSIRLPAGRYSRAITPLLHLKEILGRKVDGIIGHNFFTGKYIAIDYLNGKFNVTNSTDTSGYTRIPLQYNKSKFFLEASVTINGKPITGTFLLDTGDGGTIDLTSGVGKSYSLHSIPIERAIYHTTAGGVGGESSYGKIIAQEIRLDTFSLKDASVSYSLNDSGALASDEYLGLIGSQVLNRFDVILDLKDKNLFLRPNADYGKPFKNYSHGILYVDRTDICDGFIVNGMRKGGAAEKAGLKENDILAAIDAAPVKGLSREKVNELLNDPKDHILSVERDGNTLELNFKPEPTL